MKSFEELPELPEEKGENEADKINKQILSGGFYNERGEEQKGYLKHDLRYNIGSDRARAMNQRNEAQMIYTFILNYIRRKQRQESGQRQMGLSTSLNGLLDIMKEDEDAPESYEKMLESWLEKYKEEITLTGSIGNFLSLLEKKEEEAKSLLEGISLFSK